MQGERLTRRLGEHPLGIQLHLFKLRERAEFTNGHTDLHAQIVLSLTKPGTRQGNDLSRMARNRHSNEIKASSNLIGWVVIAPACAWEIDL